MGDDTTAQTVIFSQRVDAGGVTHYLVVRNGPEAGRHIEVTLEAQQMGRSEADLTMADRAVSKLHCEIVMFGDSLIVKDLGSTNGTFIDGQEVTAPTSLPVGSMLQVGETLLVHEVRTPEEVAQDEQLSEDVDRAVEYVLSLLPAPLSEGPVRTQWRYIPSAQLGGDAFGMFVMTSNHFAMTYSSDYNWAVLVAISIAGALIRIYFVARQKGDASLLPVFIALILLLAVSFLIVPKSTVAAAHGDTNFADVRRVVHERCTTCHSASPTHPAFPAAPAGVELDSDAQIIAEALRIHQQTVVTRVMPISNLTNISDEERALIDQWFQAGAPGER